MEAGQAGPLAREHLDCRQLSGQGQHVPYNLCSLIQLQIASGAELLDSDSDAEYDEENQKHTALDDEVCGKNQPGQYASLVWCQHAHWPGEQQTRPDHRRPPF